MDASDTPMDEAQLETALKEAQMGSSVAFGRVYGEFSGRVFGLCRKMLGSHAAAEDATSEVFERAYRALDQYDRERPFDRWILTIASRHCLNRLRRERFEKRLFHDEPLELTAAPASSSPLAACENQEQRRALLVAIDALPENYRLPLILKYYGDLSYDEIAEHLGTTRNNVAVLLHRAKRELRGSIATLQKDES
jgi:RNA polymerase sigma-70 factor (ECF subfamily)